VHPGDLDPHGGLLLLYDGGVLDEDTIARITLPADELSGFAFVHPDQLATLTSPVNQRRISAALTALTTGHTVDTDPLPPH